LARILIAALAIPASTWLSALTGYATSRASPRNQQ